MRSMDDLLPEACATLDVQLIRPLAKGGQKSVYVVNHNETTVVLKLVAIAETDPAALERARREVDLLAAVDHPNVVGVSSGMATLGAPVDGAAWLENYLTGVDLAALLGTPWGEDKIFQLGIDIAKGAGALHQHHVVHRDLSARNVRRLESGEYVILDPGFAKHTLRSGLTVGGQPGTPGFMTPEHLRAYTAPTPASDVFAIGSLLYASATGNLPFPWTGDEAEYITRLIDATHEPLQRARPELRAELSELIERCLHSHPARRFRNGGALAAAMEGIR